MKFSNRIAVFLLIMFVHFHKSEESRDVDDYDINIRNRGQINGRTIAEGSNGGYITDRNNQRDLLQYDGNMNHMGQDHRVMGSGNRNHLSTNNDNNMDQDRRIIDKGNRYHFSTHNDDNIISGNNIRNRVQINGRTIGEGSKGDDITDGYKHNMGYDIGVKGEGNRDRLSTNKDRNMDYDLRVKGNGDRDHFSTNNDPNIGHDNRATGNGNRDRYHSHNNDNIISGNNIRNRVQINGKTIKAIKTVNDSYKKQADKQPTNENFDPETDRYHSHNNDNIISGNNIRNRVQMNGKTINEVKTAKVSDKKEADKQPTNEKFDPTTKALSFLEKAITWIG